MVQGGGKRRVASELPGVHSGNDGTVELRSIISSSKQRRASRIASKVPFKVGAVSALSRSGFILILVASAVAVCSDR
jgi:hypothetical protein